MGPGQWRSRGGGVVVGVEGGFLCERRGIVTKGLIAQVLFRPLIKREWRKHAAVAHMQERSGVSLWNFM